jgi:putative DNA primase/helicase
VAPVAASAPHRNTPVAQWIWRATSAVEDVPASLAYLRRERGIASWDGDRLRAHPACLFRVEDRFVEAPALVAPVNCHRAGHVVGAWRVRLTDDGRKVERSTLGATKGNASRLFWAEGDELAVAEGVEDSLAVHQLTGLPCWAALSAGNMAELVLPARFRRVTIYADADEPGRRRAHELARRLRAEGRDARVLRPIAGKDPNAVVLGTGPAS